jgi:hypothetical protein
MDDIIPGIAFGIVVVIAIMFVIGTLVLAGIVVAFIVVAILKLVGVIFGVALV